MPALHKAADRAIEPDQDISHTEQDGIRAASVARPFLGMAHDAVLAKRRGGTMSSWNKGRFFVLAALLAMLGIYQLAKTHYLSGVVCEVVVVAFVVGWTIYERPSRAAQRREEAEHPDICS